MRIDEAGLITLSSIPRVTAFFSSLRSPPATCLQDQVIAYYTRQFVEAPKILLATHDSQINYCAALFTTPQFSASLRQQFCRSPWPVQSSEQASQDRSTSSTLQLAILAIAHATFGRSTKNSAALLIGSKTYSQALVATRSIESVVMDEVILTILLLGHFENSVAQNAQFDARDIKVISAKAFTHHDGAIVMLNSRQKCQKEPYRSRHKVVPAHGSDSGTSHKNTGSEIDKIARRQLGRSLVLRSIPIPGWLKNGSLFGEIGSSLVLDKCLVEVADLRYCVNNVSNDLDGISATESRQMAMKMRGVLVLAQELETKLAKWAREVPMVDHWSRFRLTVDDDDDSGTSDIFDQTVHLYPSIGHAAMWAQYRAIRLHGNDIILTAFYSEVEFSNSETKFNQDIIKLNMEKLALDFCASLPFALGWVELGGTGMKMICRGRRIAAVASTASLFCWPLTVSTIVSEIPEQHRSYLKSRLLDISEIVDDGVLERIAHL
ncbi:hypothetical protein BOTCAL_0154g00120 [Botryotinia calthae]|uniref:Transcription factor domain-containing protein n=1 Tax=Botryotinia calthae TaxID=38488 RepID=A0A4Y8D2P8_9HELO|nr:hypothetical protein BOTCAL_0154g00120 [Botryotinia calthae]